MDCSGDEFCLFLCLLVPMAVTQKTMAALSFTLSLKVLSSMMTLMMMSSYQASGPANLFIPFRVLFFFKSLYH